jgi:hypothetical protein
MSIGAQTGSAWWSYGVAGHFDRSVETQPAQVAESYEVLFSLTLAA